MTTDTQDIYKIKTKARRLETILVDLFEIVENAIVVLRVIIYVGSVLMAWFYLHDKTLAIAIIACLSVAHLLIEARYYVAKKKKEVREIE